MARSPRPKSLMRRSRPPAWSNVPNSNPPQGTVGPNVAEPGVVLDTWRAQAWSGWPDDWATPWLEPFTDVWTGTGYGRGSTDDYLKRVSTVMTCADLNTRQLASFPIYGVRGTEPLMLPSWSETPEPTIYADWSDFMKAAINSYQLAGELFVYCIARFATGFPSRFVVLNPRKMEMLDPDDESVPDTYPYDGSVVFRYNATHYLDPADVCHVRYQTMAGRLRGIGPIEWLGRNLVSSAALEKMATRLATHGVWAVLKNPANLNATQREDAKRNWMEARRGDPAAPAVLSGQWEFDTLNLSPTDMALLDLKVFDDQRIASAFGVPPFLVGLPQPGGMTYSNVTSLYDAHWRQTLRPMAQSVAGALSRWLLPRGTRFEFNRDEYVRPAFNERANGYAVMHGIVDGQGRPAMTVDEIRTAERFPPYDPNTLDQYDVDVEPIPLIGS